MKIIDFENQFDDGWSIENIINYRWNRRFHLKIYLLDEKMVQKYHLKLKVLQENNLFGPRNIGPKGLYRLKNIS